MIVDSAEVAALATRIHENQQAMVQEKNKAALVPQFPALTAKQLAGGQIEVRQVKCPPHRYTPLKESWENIMKPIVEHMKLQVRFNPKKRCKSADFVQAFMLGFDVQDAVALLRLDDLYVDSFEIKDVKDLKG
eukprot:GSMAST32.ASY1.ANO1.2454.1 assembled CDS